MYRESFQSVFLTSGSGLRRRGLEEACNMYTAFFCTSAMTERRGRGGQARQGTRALGDAAHARLLAWLCRAGLKAGPSMLNYIPDLVYDKDSHYALPYCTNKYRDHLSAVMEKRKRTGGKAIRGVECPCSFIALQEQRRGPSQGEGWPTTRSLPQWAVHVEASSEC